MRYYKEKEFVCRCCGELPPFARANLEALVNEVLDPLREAYGKPIVVNSGYRCPKHNKEVGGVNGSQHMKGEAADISPVHGEGFTVHGSSSSRIIEFENDLQRLKQIIIANGKFDQLILYPTFIHVSWKRNGQNRKQILKKVGCGGTATYRTVRREEVLV